MKLPSTLLSLLLSLTLVTANLLNNDRTTERPRRRNALLRNQDQQQRLVRSQGNIECQEGKPLCAPSMSKVLDFSADNGQILSYLQKSFQSVLLLFSACQAPPACL